MNCLDFRRLIGAEPSSPDAAAAEHARTCAACADFAERTRTLDRRILQALQVQVPPQPEMQKFMAESAATASERRWRLLPGASRWLAVAASLLIGIGVAAAMWVLFPRAALATDVVAHMKHEPQAWITTRDTVAPARLQAVLERSDVKTNIDLGRVSYAQSCWFRSHFVPHLVIQDAQGPVTVMLLPNETVAHEQPFSEDGYSGVILPSTHGSIAVLARDSELVRARAVAASVLKAMR